MSAGLPLLLALLLLALLALGLLGLVALFCFGSGLFCFIFLRLVSMRSFLLMRALRKGPNCSASPRTKVSLGIVTPWSVNIATKMRSPSSTWSSFSNGKNCDLPLLPQTIRPSSLAATRR